MEEKTTVPTTEEVVTEPAAGAAEAMPETLNAFQKFMHQLMGKKEEPSEDGAKPAEEDGAEAKPKPEAAKEKTYTEDDFKSVVAAEKKKWQEEQSEKERLAKLPPEERAKAEQDGKDKELGELRAKLLQKELKDTVVADLSKDGFPVGLASFIDYGSEESMKASLEKTKELFKTSLSEAVNQKLRGKTPAGLGGAASAENAIKDQIAKNIRGGM